MPVVSQDVAVAYRVEVSGSDSRQEFFVERTERTHSQFASTEARNLWPRNRPGEFSYACARVFCGPARGGGGRARQ
jgi:hypothetical protein